MPSRIRIGPDGGPYVIVEEDNGDVNISSPNGNVDFQTDDISNVGELTADSLSTGELNGVRYLSDYSTLQAAVDDTPEGKTLIVDGSFDIATIGTATTTTGINIEGHGWSVDTNGNVQGSKLINTGGDTVDAPILEFNGSSTGIQSSSVNIEHLAILHEGVTTAAVDITNFAHSLVFNTYIQCNNIGQDCLILEGSNQSRLVYSFLRGFTRYGVRFYGGGSSCQVHHSQATSATGDPVAGIRIEQPNTWVYGGQYNASNSSGDGAGVQFWSPGENVRNGGAVGVIGEDGRAAVDIDGTGSGFFRGVTVDGVFAGNNADACVRFGADALSCTSRYPNGDTGTDHTIFAGGRNTTIVPIGESQKTLTANSPVSPLMMVTGTATDAQLSNITTGSVAVMVAYSNDHNGPVIHDTTNWREFSNSTFTP